ncbi:hypothetical protein GCM10007304_05130 [Rhodococcoides trifolii]|uniref:SnoaL-like domain-containing protein n=1 Tax=Rhodococcoides trifolii TaxID=908250 RepID=A0A917FMQ6_9NOCA|nr:nuclear transport factor 2 family protein [Rhodococcus trifolii]GGF94301.1 hypothetical protein GCM10007304_05130 [Rhodococcus trifolii]
MSENRWAVDELLARYSHVVDNAAWEELSSVFTADAVVDAEFSEVIGLDAIRGLLESFDPLRSHHTLNTITKTDESGAIHAWSRFLIVEFDATSLTGDYVDELVETTDGLRISKRRISTRNRPEDSQGRRESFATWS